MSDSGTLAYVVTPLAAWVVAGSLKFAVNSVRAGRLAWDLAGYGGWPSTHAAVVSSAFVLIGLRVGWRTPEAAIGLALCLVVSLDAAGIRRLVGAHGQALNALTGAATGVGQFRERTGHSWIEVIAGWLVGTATAAVSDWLFRY